MKRSLAILSAMVLALGVVGVGYATWTSNLYIQGSITTGTLSWVWSNWVPQAGFGTATISIAHSGDYKTLTITVDKVYPGWKGYIDLTETNNGNLPLVFQSFEIQSTGGSGFAPYYQVAFYGPNTGTVINNSPAVVPNDGCNYANWISNIDGTALTYASFLDGAYPAAVTLLPGQSQTSRVTFFLDPSVPEAYMATAYTFTFTHSAVVALS